MGTFAAAAGLLEIPVSTGRPMMRRIAVAFMVSLLGFTTILVAISTTRQVPRLDQAASAAAIATLIVLSLPFILATTIPMAVFVAVLWTFTRLGSEGTIESVRQTPRGLRRLLTPTIAFATAVAGLTLGWNAEVLPRTNARLVAMMEGSTAAPGDRSMTLGELRSAARDARASSSTASAMRVARYEIELHKKFSLAAACIALALAAAAVGIRFPRGGSLLVVAASFVVFGAYYVSFIAGETLADRLAISPFLAMWGPNALATLAAILLMWGTNSRGMSGATSASAGPNVGQGPGRDTAPLAFAPR
jgi:lipopolysaccharide export LptBFGC system permease protein LptF